MPTTRARQPPSYGPFGEPNVTTGTPRRYTGQLLDPDTGLYYYKARWYSPYMGRFLSPYPTGSRVADVQSFEEFRQNDRIGASGNLTVSTLPLSN